MKRAQELFSPEDHQAITAAVVAAEQKTAAEIVPVVANDSGRYDRAEDSAGLWLGLIAFIITWAMYPTVPVEVGDWSGNHPVVQLAAYVVVIVVGYILGASLATQIPGLRRLFTPAEQMSDECWKAARAIFFDKRVHHTADATGVLIYFSLYEHRAVVLADQNTLDLLGQERINELCREMIEQVKSANLTEAMTKTIETLGIELGKLLPRQADDVNELSDALVIIE
ncbi:TPM domain-containing protein [Rubinisphaera italica]|uniref:TPM domain-containing protein n=1 Tax=Rubinisphaera italica TaxID=2527969 RepID=A0A5C5XIA9_9PLAN|nr:hypothetical protein [Rubinisphaera italica]TWT62428.1 hypothetical protein Pan54_31700 [Rubinisphaera italica]